MTIDIEEIVRARMGRRARFIPRSALRWLAGLIHQDFINAYLSQGRMGVDFCQGAVDYLGVTLTVEGRENLPPEGSRCTFVSNHPLGAIDGLAVGAVLGKAYDGQIKYLVNDLLMNLDGLAPLCVPVNKIGAQSRDLPRLIDEAFASPCQMIMFPAGLCSRKRGGVVRDLPWGKAFVVKSRQHRRDIVPLRFVAANSPRFYRVANVCKALRLPNFAMALLPDEMYRSRGSHYIIKIGKPIAWQTLTNDKTPMEWTKNIQDTVYEL